MRVAVDERPVQARVVAEQFDWDAPGQRFVAVADRAIDQ